MRKFLGLAPVTGNFLVLCFIFLLTGSAVRAQSCPPPSNFEAAQYSTVKASYSWAYSQAASYYVIEIDVNGVQYQVTELPGNSTGYSVEFNPKLKNKDAVSATLTQYCGLGASSSTTFDFVIVTDIVIYLTGGPQNGEPNAVEPVFAVNDNLIPSTGVCGLCDPGFFRLTSGFYAPYNIGIDASIPYTIEQLRFVKSELCGCIDKAVDDGILDPNGGTGPKYAGEPFVCKLTPYVFDKKDCERKNEGGERNATAIASSLMAIPNPITSFTRVTFGLVESTTVYLSVYDITGRLMTQPLQQEVMGAGEQQVMLHTENWPNGLYFCKLQAGGTVETIKMVKEN